jgi:hypothetical protein
MRLPHLPHKYARLAKRVEEVAALYRADPLPLMAVILIEPGDETGGDVEAAKAHTLAAHLAARPQDVGREIEWTVYRVRFVEADPQPGEDELAVEASH